MPRLYSWINKKVVCLATLLGGRATIILPLLLFSPTHLSREPSAEEEYWMRWWTVAVLGGQGPYYLHC